MEQVERSDVNLPASSEFMTPLHFAARGGREECCRLLLAGGANTGLLDRRGRTAQALAAANRKAGCERMLRDAAAAEAREASSPRCSSHLDTNAACRVGDLLLLQARAKSTRRRGRARRRREPAQLRLRLHLIRQRVSLSGFASFFEAYLILLSKY